MYYFVYIHCKTCNETKDSTIISKTGHNYINGKCENCGQDEPIQYNVITLRSTAGENSVISFAAISSSSFFVIDCPPVLFCIIIASEKVHFQGVWGNMRPFAEKQTFCAVACALHYRSKSAQNIYTFLHCKAH